MSELLVKVCAQFETVAIAPLRKRGVRLVSHGTYFFLLRSAHVFTVSRAAEALRKVYCTGIPGIAEEEAKFFVNFWL